MNKNGCSLVRKAFVMKLKPGMIEEYEKKHNTVWPEMLLLLKAHGVHNYSIFYQEKTNQLFAYAEIEGESRLDDLETNEICMKWWSDMKEYLVSESDDSPKAIEEPMREVFHLE